MNPWLWILWAVAVLVIMFVASAAVAAVVDAIREHKAGSKPCPRCGFDRAKDDVGSWRPASPPRRVRSWATPEQVNVILGRDDEEEV